MYGPRVRSQSLGAIAISLFSGWASLPTASAAQEEGSRERSALEVRYSYLADLLDALDAGQRLIYDALLEPAGEPAAQIDARLYGRLVGSGLAGPDGLSALARSPSTAGEGGTSAAVPSDLLALLERSTDYHRRLLQILADPGVAQPDRAVEALVNTYLGEAGGALAADPKDMALLSEGAQAGAFAREYPRLHGLLWAQRWLELAAFEPLLLYRTPEGRQAGVMAVVARFWGMLEEAPLKFPTQMPMAPAIAPNLTLFDVRAAGILENANMLRENVADILVSEAVEDRFGALQAAFLGFQERGYRQLTFSAWRQMANMHGVGNQGGWAIGIIPAPEREEMGMDHSHHMMMPTFGME